MIFERCEGRTLAASPVFRRSQQLSADALTLLAGTYGDLNDVAVAHFPVHWIGRSVEPDVDESDDLTVEFRNQSDGLRISVRRMLPAFAVACRNGLDCRQTIALRIEAGVMLSAIHVDEDDAVSVF